MQEQQFILPQSQLARKPSWCLRRPRFKKRGYPGLGNRASQLYWMLKFETQPVAERMVAILMNAICPNRNATLLLWLLVLLNLAVLSGRGSSVPGRSLPLEASEVFDDPGAAALSAAAERGDIAEIRRLVQEEGVDVNHVGEQGITPLLRALSRKNWEGFSELLALGADPNRQMSNGGTVINLAARLTGEPRWLSLALEHGGNPDLPNRMNPNAHGATPIFYAIAEHNVEGVQVLIDGGADVDFVDDLGMAPIHEAGDFSYWDIVYLLLEAGADYKAKNRHGVDIEMRLKKTKGLEPRGQGQAEAREKVIAFLKERGVEVE